MPNYTPAPDDVVELAQELIELYHPHLAEARIGLLMREEAGKGNGRVVLGAAKRTPADQRAYVDFDFIIWLAQDWWEHMLSPMQRRALLDHELCHCYVASNGDVSLRGHDIEEFDAIIRRYGFWRPHSERTEEAVQARFEYAQGNGRVAAADVLDQVGDLLDDEE